MAITQKVKTKTITVTRIAGNCRSSSASIVTSKDVDYKNSVDSPDLENKRENVFTGYRYFLDLGVMTPMWQVYPTSCMASYPITGITGFAESNFTYGHPAIANDNSYFQALNRFYDKVSNLKINMAQVFAERQQTVDLIANTAKKLAYYYRQLRRGRNPFTGASCNGRNASNLWLQYQYGWMPLIGDVYAAMEALKRDDPPLFRVRASASGFMEKPTMNSVAYALVSNVNTVIKHSLSGRSSTRTTVFATISIKDPALLSANYVGLTNPQLLAWELVPYSFVVDWFLPIGAWLERQTALVGLRVHQTSVTRTTMTNWSLSSSGVITSVVASKASFSSNSGFQARYKTRSPALPEAPLPRLKNPVSIVHAVSALALLRQTFK